MAALWPDAVVLEHRNEAEMKARLQPLEKEAVLLANQIKETRLLCDTQAKT